MHLGQKCSWNVGLAVFLTSRWYFLPPLLGIDHLHPAAAPVGGEIVWCGRNTCPHAIYATRQGSVQQVGNGPWRRALGGGTIPLPDPHRVAFSSRLVLGGFLQGLRCVPAQASSVQLTDRVLFQSPISRLPLSPRIHKLMVAVWSRMPGSSVKPLRGRLSRSVYLVVGPMSFDSMGSSCSIISLWHTLFEFD